MQNYFNSSLDEDSKIKRGNESPRMKIFGGVVLFLLLLGLTILVMFLSSDTQVF